MALAVDPLFFYALSIGRGGSPCLYMDGGLAAVVTVVRTCLDAVHLCHLWLQFRLAYVSRESLVHYLGSVKGFWFDAFVILPVPQAVFWLVLPKLIREEKIKLIMTILLIIFMFQFLPKVYHSIYLMRRMQKVTGYIFGTIWWGFGLNLIAYFIASHVAGGCWYVLAIQRVASCLKQQCELNGSCNLSLSCSEEVCYQFLLPSDTLANPCGGGNSTVVHREPMCLDVNGPFGYGIYKWALPVVSSNSVAVKILYPIFWGLMTLSTFGNDLEPTSNWLEVMFSISTVLSGLLLFTLLIGNIQVFLHAVMAKKRKMQLRCRDMEWWMKRRQLPSQLRHRVRRYERQRWATVGCDDEMELIRDLPEGLRRDIKRFLCLDLMKKVPLFQSLDNLILDNICDRLKPLILSKDEKIIREGDPVPRIVFIMHGRVKSSQKLSRGIVATSLLEPGGFFGDELFTWCLRRPFMDRLPASSATFSCVEPTEAFALEAKDLKYVVDHFRYKFANERLTRTARYYSSNWRTWAAVNIQLAWRRYNVRTRSVLIRRSTNGDSDRLLRQYAAFFMSVRPHDHLE
ncbi:cyclic nucleotide-gated ion channel 2 [Phtheirospermum japonicum]|uniref:Cyclic nucleotide-gated ion channel 2 n=1 Tax=Phtheirospermum japonicum TaxID=374723 RepID=A0A830BVW1_9LAMI|nr:cyclic nucleotide-gated ion channel 2 [Phtheirospermum japonicum]